jgi:hypothetical protein
MADQAQEPLMRDEEVDEDELDTTGALEDGPQKPNLFVWLLTLSAGISGLLFGCKMFSLLWKFSLFSLS